MTDLTELMERVDRAFDQVSPKPDPWPDPHPDRSPSDDEYSRVTNPERWRIVGARADAWLEALGAAGLATIERDADVEWVEQRSPVITRSDLARPRVTGGLPLILARSRIETVDDGGLTIGVGDPAVVHDWIPDCGCDACDSGSQDALDQLDDYLTGIVTGEFRRLQRRGRTITVISSSSRRQSSSGRRSLIDADRVLADPRGWSELSGPSWLTS